MAYAFSDSAMVFGHRGVPWEAPANTLAGFRRAVELGLAGVELDVQLCATGEAVVIHDYTVDGTTDGTGRVENYALERLRELDAGSWFGSEFAGERIPTLDEVLDATGPDLLLNLEIKSESVKSNGVEAVLADRVRAHGAEQRVLVSSFNPFALFRAKKLLPGVAVGLLYAPDTALYLRRAWFAPVLQPEAMHPEYSMLTPAGVALARRYGTMLNTWTVNDVTEMRRIVDLGVNAIITDEPRVLQAVVAGEPPPPPMEMTYKAAREKGAPA